MHVIARSAPAVLFFLLTGLRASLAADESAPCPTPGKVLKAVVSTHTLPTYPRAAVGAEAQGVTLLTINIGTDGSPAEVVVTRPSGSQALDDAAASHVKAHFRWQPPLEDCKPASLPIQIMVGWHVDAPPKADSGHVMAVTQYPAGAVERFEAGDSYVELSSDESGAVQDAHVAYSSGYADLDDKALTLLKTTPGIMAGKPAGRHILLARWRLPAPQKDDLEMIQIYAHLGKRD